MNLYVHASSIGAKGGTDRCLAKRKPAPRETEPVARMGEDSSEEPRNREEHTRGSEEERGKNSDGGYVVVSGGEPDQGCNAAESAESAGCVS